MDDADRLVSNGQTRLDWILATDDMNVRPADCREPGFHNGLAISRSRYRFFFQAKVTGATKDKGFHYDRGRNSVVLPLGLSERHTLPLPSVLFELMASMRRYRKRYIR